MTEKKPTRQAEPLDDELVDELKETAATLTRLGVTLAGLPMALLPRRQREQARHLAGELTRMGAIIPRTIGALMDEAADEWHGDEREDLGSRLRREQEKARMAEAGPEDQTEREEPHEATEAIEEEVQEALNSPPAPPDELTEGPPDTDNLTQV